jgi:Tol biopolymer transport system component
MKQVVLLLIAIVWLATALKAEGSDAAPATAFSSEAKTNGLLLPGEERHLTNVRQLTFGGENAEAYFSSDGSMLSFQSTRDTFDCDQIFVMKSDGSDVKLLSTGKGRTTCSFIQPDGQKMIYASTHGASPDCPPRPDMSRGYVWALYSGFDIYQADPDGSHLINLTDSPLYDAECVYSPDGSLIAFTSLRSGDLEIYTMKADGSDVRMLTSTAGYDGGPFFSPDSRRIVYRASRPASESELEDYRLLLSDNLIRPGSLELFVMNADGSNNKQITFNGAANFAPFFHPDGKRIVFCSNLADTSKSRRNFDLFLINDDGSGLEQLTYNSTFDGFPMFSYDGKRLVFCSNRNNEKSDETNVCIADWID